MTTTHVDLQNERLTKAALESLVEQVNQAYIPINVNHDPRQPPVGRVREARLVELPDGEFGVEAISEIFDSKDMPESDGREVIVKKYDDGKIHLGYDYSYYSDPQLVAEIETLATKTGIRPQTAAKKAAVPISELVIGVGVLAGGSFAVGFFNKLGADAADLLRKSVKTLIGAQRRQATEQLLTFDVTANLGGRLVAVEAILTNPTDEEIDEFLTNGVGKLDDFVKQVEVGERIRKIVLGYAKGQFTAWYALREDGVPVTPQAKPDLDNPSIR